MGDDGENLTIEAFVDQAHRDDFIAAKAELICARGKERGLSSDKTTSTFDGLVYVEAGNVIIEPDTAEIRNAIARELGLTAGNMCPGITNDTAYVPGS